MSLFPTRPRIGSVQTFSGTDWEAAVSLNGGLTINARNVVSEVTNVPTWLKVGTRSFTDFSAAATTSTITMFSLVPGGVIQAVKIKHSAAFGGGAIATYTVSVGISGTLAKYATAFDVFQAASGTALQLSSTVGTESHTAEVAITATATSSGANLNAATVGTLDVWALVSRAV